jgi:hypothetical protein
VGRAHAPVRQHMSNCTWHLVHVVQLLLVPEGGGCCMHGGACLQAAACMTRQLHAGRMESAAMKLRAPWSCIRVLAHL